MANSTVYLNDYSSPLLYVSPRQINFQVPWELAGVSSASLTVVTNGIPGDPVIVNLSSVAPALLSTNQQGSGQGAILLAGTATVADAAHPVNRTDTISIFCLGLGPVSSMAVSGAASPSNPLLTTQAQPTVTIGGVPGSVLFSGLAPGFVGVYQVNVRLPLNAPAGSAVPVVLQIGGVYSNTVTIGIQ